MADMPQVDGTRGAVEDHRPSLQVLGWCVGVVGGIERSFGNGDIACGIDEFGIFGVGYLARLNPELVDADRSRRPFLGIVVVGSDHCSLRRNPRHILTEIDDLATFTRTFSPIRWFGRILVSH
jgi:hypothetical protein